jgi:membrane protein implicated in regulation of membrane protease activity
MAIAGLGMLMPNLTALDAGEWAVMGWPQKIAFFLEPVMASLLTWRAFLDQTLGRAQDAAPTPPDPTEGAGKAIVIPEPETDL